MNTYPMINDTGTPIRVTFEQLYERFNKRLVERLRWKLDIDITEAEEQAQHAWLILLEKLNTNKMFLAGKPFGWVWRFLVYRAMAQRYRRERSRENCTDDEIIAIAANGSRRNKHANFAEQVDFWLDFKQAAEQVARQVQHNDLLTWALYLTITGRKPEVLDWHDTRSKRADRTGKHCAVWCPHTRAAIQQILGYEESSIRKARRFIQLQLQLTMSEYN